jgi:Small-conductance mechanosensitive channel
MAVGMAMSGAVQNFAGGLILLAFKPFKVGEFIEAQGFFGRVSEITIVHTKIVTTDNREVTIPNGAISNGTIDNYSCREPHRLSLKFNVPYGTDFDQVKSILLEMVKQQPLILNKETNPGAKNPKVYVDELEERRSRSSSASGCLLPTTRKSSTGSTSRFIRNCPRTASHSRSLSWTFT